MRTLVSGEQHKLPFVNDIGAAEGIRQAIRTVYLNDIRIDQILETDLKRKIVPNSFAFVRLLLWCVRFRTMEKSASKI